MAQTSQKGPGNTGNNPPAKQLTGCGDVSCSCCWAPSQATPVHKVTHQAPYGGVTFVDHHKPNSRLLWDIRKVFCANVGLRLEMRSSSRKMPARNARNHAAIALRGGGLVLCGISD